MRTGLQNVTSCHFSAHHLHPSTFSACCRRGQKKKSRREVIPNILFVNKPHFSSESSLSNIVDLEAVEDEERRARSEPRQLKKHSSQLMLRIPSKSVGNFEVVL